MTCIESSGDEFSGQDRRRVLAACAAVGSGALAGCSGLFGDGGQSADDATETARPSETASPSGTATPEGFTPTNTTYGFENGLGELFADSSQRGSSPAVTDDRAFTGERSLVLASEPGARTRCSVSATQSFQEPVQYAVRMNRYRSAGPDNAAGFRLRDAGSDARLAMYCSGARDGVVVTERPASGRTTHRGVTSMPAGDEWHTYGFELRDESLAAVVDDEAELLFIREDWLSKTCRFELFANGRESGHAVEAAFDVAEVNWPESA